MSATNRNGLARHPNDFYETPAWCVDLVLDELGLNADYQGYVIDPGSGTGAIAQRVAIRSPKADVQGVELTQELADKARGLRVPSIAFDVADFKTWEGDGQADLVIGNPPFSDAEAFVRKSLELVKAKGSVAMLLRLGWASGKIRRAFWAEHKADICILERRPSFNGSGCDACDYAWFVWGPKRTGRWSRLEEKPKKVAANGPLFTPNT